LSTPDNLVSLQATEFVSESAAMDSRQHATQFAESLRAIKEKADNPQLPFSADCCQYGD
jgi:hypothetical protein